MDDNYDLIDNLYKLRQGLAKEGRVIGNIDVCERHLKMCIENGARKMESGISNDDPLSGVYILMGFFMMCEPFERCAICSVE